MTRQKSKKSRFVELVKECYDFDTYKEAIELVNDEEFLCSDEHKDIKDYLHQFDN